MLILLGLFPVVGVIFSLMPDPVLGGATLLMFGTVAAAGIRIIAAQDINRKATLVLAVSLSLGVGGGADAGYFRGRSSSDPWHFLLRHNDGWLDGHSGEFIYTCKEDQTE